MTPVTTKIGADTRKLAKEVAARTGETMMALLARLVRAEWDRVEAERRDKAR